MQFTVRWRCRGCGYLRTIGADTSWTGLGKKLELVCPNPRCRHNSGRLAFDYEYVKTVKVSSNGHRS